MTDPFKRPGPALDKPTLVADPWAGDNFDIRAQIRVGLRESLNRTRQHCLYLAIVLDLFSRWVNEIHVFPAYRWRGGA